MSRVKCRKRKRYIEEGRKGRFPLLPSALRQAQAAQHEEACLAHGRRKPK